MERDKHETKFDNRECSENRSGICTAVFAVLFLQTLYGMADLFITGQFYGVDSITAVANGSQVMHMITVILVGLAMGATVIIGRAVGGNRMDEAGKAVGNTVTLFMVLAAALMAVLLCLARPIVILIGTPEEAVAETVQYLVI